MSLVPLSTFETFWQSRQQQVLLSTPLIGNATYTSASFDSLASPQASMVSANVFADQAGTLYMDVSMDNTNWNYNQFSISVSANTATVMPWQNPIDRYYRFRYVNGSTAQGTFRLSTSSTNNAGIQNVNASVIGSLPKQITEVIFANAVQIRDTSATAHYLPGNTTYDQALVNPLSLVPPADKRTIQLSNTHDQAVTVTVYGATASGVNSTRYIAGIGSITLAAGARGVLTAGTGTEVTQIASLNEPFSRFIMLATASVAPLSGDLIAIMEVLK